MSKQLQKEQNLIEKSKILDNISESKAIFGI